MSEYKLLEKSKLFYDSNIDEAVNKAMSLRSGIAVNKAESFKFDDSALSMNNLTKYSIAFNEAVNLLKVPDKDIKDAKDKYNEVAKYLCQKLKWDEDSIEVFPQGSVRTKTLIKSADGSNFDIDAVCKVDLSKIETNAPLKFFDLIGDALGSYYESHLSGQDVRKPEAKRRCWKINFANTSFYLEFTPSVLLSEIETDVYENFAYNYTPTLHKESALAVVDVPTKKWKTSNPKGFADWINDVSSLQVLTQVALESFDRKFEANVENVPSQEIKPSDTLRTIIILFKRHRDMAVKRGVIQSENKPISVLLVTLITEAYFYLHQRNNYYTDPVDVMLVIAELLKKGPRRSGDDWYVENPTVEGENFAEKWNTPGEGVHKSTSYFKWVELLTSDMKTIINVQRSDEIIQKVLQVFGLGHTNQKGPKPKNIPPKGARPVPPTNGLA
jgi:hypothetical protein